MKKLYLMTISLLLGNSMLYSGDVDYYPDWGMSSDYSDEEESHVSTNPVINNLYNNFWLEDTIATSADLESMGIVTPQDIKNLRQEIQNFLLKKQEESGDLLYKLATGVLIDLDYDQKNIEFILNSAQRQINLLDILV